MKLSFLTFEQILLVVALLILISVVMSKVAVRLGVPVLLLFLGFGMLLGSEGLVGIAFDNAQLTQNVGVVALIYILFSGGIHTDWKDIKPVLKEGILLATVGVLITAGVVAVFAKFFLGFTWASAMLLGAIMSSTDAAAVFSVLGGGIQLRGKTKQILEFESGSNDPMAIFLTLGMIELISGTYDSIWQLLPMFFLQMSVGGALGYLLGHFMRVVVNFLRLEYDGLYSVLTLSMVLLVYAVTAQFGGNGFLAVYIAGLVLSKNKFIHKQSLRNFHDGIAWIMQIVMFLTLGLQIFPSRLLAIMPVGLVTAAVLIFLARPLSVFAALYFTKLYWREKAFISWVGLRGAAPIILATFPLLAGTQTPLPIFELVFFVVLTSVLLQGTLIVWVAEQLHMMRRVPTSRSLLSYITRDTNLTDYLSEYTIGEHAQVVGKQIVELQLPDEILILLIRRGDQVVIPRGSTILQVNDQVLVLSRTGAAAFMDDFFCAESPALI